MSGARQLKVEFAPGASPFAEIGSVYLDLPGTLGPIGSGASAPDSASLSITGDIDIRVEFYCDDTRNVAPVLFTKWDTTSDERSYALEIFNNRLAFIWSTDGTDSAGDSVVSDEALPDFTGPTRLAVRSVLDVDNGAAGRDVGFYYADSIAGPWTQLGTTQTSAGSTSIFNSTAIAQVGNINYNDFLAEQLPFVGKIYAAEVRNGIGGTVVANPDFTIQTPGDTSFQDTAGIPNTWTVNSPGEIVGTDWVDLSERVISATWTYGRDDELDSHPSGTATVVMKNDDRELDPDHASGTYFGQLLPRVPFRLRSSWSSLRLPGASGAHATTPDHASLALTDLDVRFQLAMDDWTPGGFGNFLGGQWGGEGQQSWVVGLTTAGNLTLVFTTDGSTDQTRTSTSALSFTNGDDHWIRVTLDANNGAAGHDVNFYTSEDGVTWTQLGTTVTTAGTVALHNSTASLTLGSSVAGLDPTCDVRYFEVRSAIDGTVVASVDALTLEPGTTSFRDTSDKLWTINGTAAVQIDSDYFTDDFYGFVEGGWEQDFSPPEVSNVQVQLTDRVGLIGGYTLPDVYEHAVLLSRPDGFWILDQTDTAEAVSDLSGNNNDGIVVGSVQFGDRPIAPGHPPAARWDNDFESKNYVDIGRSPILTDPGISSVVATFIARSAATLNLHQLFVQGDGDVTATDGVQLYVDTNGAITYSWTIDGGGNAYEDEVLVVDGQGHIVFGQANGLALDTATLSNSTVAPGGGITNGVGIGGHSGIIAEDCWDGWIGSVAIFDRQLNEQDRQVILEGYGKLNGETSDVHVEFALNRLGVLTVHRNLDVGAVVMGPANSSDQDALGWIRGVTDTEQGQFYADHRDGGKLRYVNRYSRFLEDRSLSVQFKFSDNKTDSSPNLVRVERGDFDLVPNGVTSIINQTTVSWSGGSEVVSDTTSINQYGPRPRDLSTESSNPQLARSAGEWLIARYSQPRTRVDGVGLFPGAARRGYRATHHLQLGDLVEVTYHPQEVGSEVTVDLFVEGVEQRVENGVNWYAHYALSPAETFTPWIWDESLWDQTTYWG